MKPWQHSITFYPPQHAAPPHKVHKKRYRFFPITMLLDLGLPHAYWPVSTTRLLHIWLEIRSHGFADERMKRLIGRTLAEVNQPQLQVNGLVRFYDRSPLNTYHAEKLVQTMYLMKIQQTTVAYRIKSSLCSMKRLMCTSIFSLQFKRTCFGVRSSLVWCRVKGWVAPTILKALKFS